MIINTGGTKSLCKCLLKMGTCFWSAYVKALLNCAAYFLVYFVITNVIFMCFPKKTLLA